MELDSIKKIVETEKKAENIKQEAKLKAKEILEQAENSKKNNLEYFKRELEKKQEELQKKQSEANNQEKVKITAKSNERIKELSTTVKKNIPEAVNKIFNKVINI